MISTQLQNLKLMKSIFLPFNDNVLFVAMSLKTLNYIAIHNNYNNIMLLGNSAIYCMPILIDVVKLYACNTLSYLHP